MRLHDSIYLKTNRHNKPKELFKFLLKILKKNLPKNKKLKLLDIGCANGELIYFLNKNLKNIEFYGIDIRADLLKVAKNYCKETTFKKIDINSEFEFKEKFDIIICSGVMGVFDNLDLFFKNLKKLSKKQTVIYLMAFFNNYNYNINVTWNDISLQSFPTLASVNIFNSWRLGIIRENGKKF